MFLVFLAAGTVRFGCVGNRENPESGNNGQEVQEKKEPAVSSEQVESKHSGELKTNELENEEGQAANLGTIDASLLRELLQSSKESLTKDTVEQMIGGGRYKNSVTTIDLRYREEIIDPDYAYMEQKAQNLRCFGDIKQAFRGNSQQTLYLLSIVSLDQKATGK